MTRVTLKHINSLAGHLNKLLGRPETYRDEASNRTNEGHLYIEEGFQCFRLNEVANEYGGVSDVLYGGTKRELEGKMRAFEEGMRAQFDKIRQQIIDVMNANSEESSDGEVLDAVLEAMGIKVGDLS